MYYMSAHASAVAAIVVLTAVLGQMQTGQLDPPAASLLSTLSSKRSLEGLSLTFIRATIMPGPSDASPSRYEILAEVTFAFSDVGYYITSRSIDREVM